MRAFPFIGGLAAAVLFLTACSSDDSTGPGDASVDGRTIPIVDGASGDGSTPVPDGGGADATGDSTLPAPDDASADDGGSHDAGAAPDADSGPSSTCPPEDAGSGEDAGYVGDGGAGFSQPCVAQSDCQLGLWCQKPDGHCNGAGTCNVSPDVAETEFSDGPVCGCDGRTYFSSSESTFHQVNVATNGACLAAPTCSATQGCCGKASFCRTPLGACGGTGTCFVPPVGICHSTEGPQDWPCDCTGKAVIDRCGIYESGQNVRGPSNYVHTDGGLLQDDAGLFVRTCQ